MNTKPRMSGSVLDTIAIPVAILAALRMVVFALRALPLPLPFNWTHELQGVCSVWGCRAAGTRF